MNDNQKIDFVTGADLLISKAKYEQVGGFDERFFLYYEETDLQKRLVNLGYQNYLFNGTKIIHLEGGSDLGASRVSNQKRIFIHTSRNLYLKLHDKNYQKYVKADMIAHLGRLLSRNYTWNEKLKFLKTILKTY